MENVDMLFNPEQFIGMIGRMTDGNFKFKVIQYLDSLPSQVIASIFEVSQLLNITDPIEFQTIVQDLKRF